MSIVMDEHDSAAYAISNHTLGQKPTETLRRVARYIIDDGCTNRRDIKRKLNVFLTQCDRMVSTVKWDDRVEKAIDFALTHKAIRIDSIVVTEPEMQSISELKSRQARRLAFTLLCIAKYQDIAYGRNTHWVNVGDIKIMAMANINTSTKNQCKLYAQLEDAGMVQFSRRIDSPNMRVLFMRDGTPAIFVHDLRNLGYQYLKYSGDGGSFIECENCGVTVKLKARGAGRPQKYCSECASKVKLRQMADSAMRQRRIHNGMGAGLI